MPITVPVVDQTAAAAPQYTAPGVTPERNSAPEQQQQLGQTMQQTGQKAMQVGGTIGERLAEQVDDAKVKQAETGFLQQSNTILYDPQQGYLHQLGQAAIDNADSTKQAIVKAKQDAMDTASNPIQQRMLNQVLTQHLVNTGRLIDDHNFVQTTQYSGEAAINRSNVYATNASNAWSSYGQTDAEGNATGDFARSLQTAEQETLRGTLIIKGAPSGSDVSNAALLNVRTQAGAGALVQMMDARAPFSKVQSVFDDMKAKGFLDEKSLVTLGKMVKTYSEQESTRAAVNQNLSDAQRASQKLPTTSTGTPDYQFPAKGGTATAQPYNADEGAVALNLPQGSNLQAPADGKVVQVGKDDNGTFGMHIQHADGSVTTFSGLTASNVKVGDQVQRGENVATSAPTVLWSLADKNGNAVDPTKAGLAPVDLTKITDEKVLGNALDGVRKQITDPYLQQQATSEMESIVRHNQQMQNAAATQTFKSASDAFYNGGMQWSAIPPSTFNQLTGEQQQHFKDEQTQHVLQLYNQGQAFKTMSETDLVSNFIANPEMITTDNVEAARPQLSRATYLSLLEKAQTLANNPKGVIEAQAVNERIKYFATQQGLKDPDNSHRTDADKQTYTALTFKVQQDIDQIKAQNHGKATGEQVDKAIQQELIQRPVGPQPHNPDNPFVRLHIESNTPPTKYQFQMPAGATHVAPGDDGKMHYTDGTRDLGVVK